MHEGDPPKRARRPRAKAPARRRRKPPRKTEETVVRPAIAGGAAGRSGRDASEPAGAPSFDSVVEYRESLVDDFDALASDYPRSAVLGGFLIGIAVGLLLAALSRRD